MLQAEGKFGPTSARPLRAERQGAHILRAQDQSVHLATRTAALPREVGDALQTCPCARGRRV